MIELDTDLINRARRLIDGSNVHRLKHLIFAYEQAVALYNSGHYSEYDTRCENELREYIANKFRRASP